LDCRTFRSLIPRYLAGHLDEGPRQEFQSHEASCLLCHNTLKGRRSLRESVSTGVLENRSAPEELRGSIRVCMECMDHPGRLVCPRLRFKLRLVKPDAVQ